MRTLHAVQKLPCWNTPTRCCHAPNFIRLPRSNLISLYKFSCSTHEISSSIYISQKQSIVLVSQIECFTTTVVIVQVGYAITFEIRTSLITSIAMMVIIIAKLISPPWATSSSDLTVKLSSDVSSQFHVYHFSPYQQPQDFDIQLQPHTRQTRPLYSTHNNGNNTHQVLFSTINHIMTSHNVVPYKPVHARLC